MPSNLAKTEILPGICNDSECNFFRFPWSYHSLVTDNLIGIGVELKWLVELLTRITQVVRNSFTAIGLCINLLMEHLSLENPQNRFLKLSVSFQLSTSCKKRCLDFLISSGQWTTDCGNLLAVVERLSK